MSFNKYYIPVPSEFAKLIQENGPKACVNRKIDAIIGSPVSIEMFDLAHDMLANGSTEKSVISELSKKFPDHFNA